MSRSSLTVCWTPNLLKEMRLIFWGLMQHVSLQTQRVTASGYSLRLHDESQQGRRWLLQLFCCLLDGDAGPVDLCKGCLQASGQMEVPEKMTKFLFQLRHINLGVENEDMSGESQTCRSRGRLSVPLRSGMAAAATALPAHPAHGGGSEGSMGPLLQACLFLSLVPRHLQLPTAGCDIRLDDNYRVKCQLHSQEHHYPLAN